MTEPRRRRVLAAQKSKTRISERWGPRRRAPIPCARVADFPPAEQSRRPGPASRSTTARGSCCAANIRAVGLVLLLGNPFRLSERSPSRSLPRVCPRPSPCSEESAGAPARSRSRCAESRTPGSNYRAAVATRSWRMLAAHARPRRRRSRARAPSDDDHQRGDRWEVRRRRARSCCVRVRPRRPWPSSSASSRRIRRTSTRSSSWGARTSRRGASTARSRPTSRRPPSSLATWGRSPVWGTRCACSASTTRPCASRDRSS